MSQRAFFSVCSLSTGFLRDHNGPHKKWRRESGNSSGEGPGLVHQILETSIFVSGAVRSAKTEDFQSTF